MSVSEDLPILQASHSIFDVSDPLPVQYTISVNITEATGPDKTPPWIVRDFAQQLAGPVTSIFNSSLREDVLPKLWTTATVIPLPKKRPPESIENDIRPIALTPILAKVVRSIVGLLKMVDNIIITQIDDKQFGGMAGTGTTDALVEMLHKWYATTDEPGTTVRVLFLDYRKAFDLIYHETLINKLVAINLPAHIIRWMAAFLLDHEKLSTIGESVSQPGYPNGGVPQGTLSGPKTCWCILTIYGHLVLFISTSMTVPYLKYAILPVYRCYSSPLPLLLIGLLTMVCELIQWKLRKLL